MIKLEHIEESIEFIKQKYSYYSETSTFWKACFEGIDLPGDLLTRLVRQEVINGTEKPSASKIRARLLAIERSQQIDKRRESQTRPIGEDEIRVITDYSREGGYSYRVVPKSRAHVLNEHCAVLKADYCTAILGILATDQLRQGKTLDEVYQIALDEVRSLGRKYELTQILEFFGYSGSRREQSKQLDPVDLLQGLASKMIAEKQRKEGVELFF